MMDSQGNQSSQEDFYKLQNGSLWDVIVGRGKNNSSPLKKK